MKRRDIVSEAMLWTMIPFTSLLLMICPGALLWFALPPPVGFVALLLCGAPGPLLLLRMDRDIYGPRT